MNGNNIGNRNDLFLGGADYHYGFLKDIIVIFKYVPVLLMHMFIGDPRGNSTLAVLIPCSNVFSSCCCKERGVLVSSVVQ